MRDVKRPMRRQDRQALKRWLKTMHPLVPRGSYSWHNKRISINHFPTHAAAIKRFFAWCHRHGRDPAHRLNYCLYWGVCEPQKEGKWRTKPIFRDISVAMLEDQIGASCDMDAPADITATRDSWSITVECFTDNRETLENCNEYGRDSDRIRIKEQGRFFLDKLTIELTSMEMFSYQTDKSPDPRYSVSSRVEARFTPRLPWGYKFRATTTLTPSGSAVGLVDIIETFVRAQTTKAPYDYTLRLGRYAHRDLRYVKKRARHQRKTRQHNRERRHKRRALARSENQ